MTVKITVFWDVMPYMLVEFTDAPLHISEVLLDYKASQPRIWSQILIKLSAYFPFKYKKYDDYSKLCDMGLN
jgi:hypothetical protein